MTAQHETHATEFSLTYVLLFEHNSHVSLGMQQVVGRVHLGMDIVDRLNSAEIDFKDKPVSPVTISSCGLTDAQGTHESVEETAAALAKQKETPEQAAARLQADAATVKDALQ